MAQNPTPSELAHRHLKKLSESQPRPAKVPPARVTAPEATGGTVLVFERPNGSTFEIPTHPESAPSLIAFYKAKGATLLETRGAAPQGPAPDQKPDGHFGGKP